MIHAWVNEKKFDIDISQSNKKIFFQSNEIFPDVFRVDSTRFHILWNHRSFNAEIAAIHHDTKVIQVKVNGTHYTVALKDSFDALLQQLGLETGATKKQKDIRAPMPGMVLNVLVQAGDSIEKEAPLVILEAMKMENIIKSPTAGKIKKIVAVKGQAVEKNTILIEFE